MEIVKECTRDSIENQLYHLSHWQILCRMCGKTSTPPKKKNKGECGLMQHVDATMKRQYYTYSRIVHWMLCVKSKLERSEMLYEHKPLTVGDNESVKLFWDFLIQCANVIEARRPDIIILQGGIQTVLDYWYSDTKGRNGSWKRRGG